MGNNLCLLNLIVISYDAQVLQKILRKWLAKKVLINHIRGTTNIIFFGKNKTKILNRVGIY